MTVERQVADLSREVGQLTVAVQNMAKQMEDDREERKEYRKEAKERLDGHGKRLRVVELTHKWVGGAGAALAAVFGIKLHWPF